MATSEILSVAELESIGGGLDGWGFTGAVLAIGACTIAVATATVWGAVGGLHAIDAVGADAMSIYVSGKTREKPIESR